MRINESVWLPGVTPGGVVVVGNDGPRIIIIINICLIIYIKNYVTMFVNFTMPAYYSHLKFEVNINVVCMMFDYGLLGPGYNITAIIYNTLC